MRCRRFRPPPKVGRDSIALGSDYLVRGISHSSNDPALSAEVHAQFAGNFFAQRRGDHQLTRDRGPSPSDLNATLGFAGAAGR